MINHQLQARPKDSNWIVNWWPHMEFAEYIQTMPWQLFHMAHNGKFMIDQKEERRHWGGGYILQLSIFCIAIAYFVYLHWHCLCFMVNTDDVSRFYCLVTHSLSLILCKGKVNITIEILVNPKAAFKLAIGVSHMFAINVIDPWEETTMLLSWELVLKIFFLVSLTIHIVKPCFVKKILKLQWGRVTLLVKRFE